MNSLAEIKNLLNDETCYARRGSFTLKPYSFKECCEAYRILNLVQIGSCEELELSLVNIPPLLELSSGKTSEWLNECSRSDLEFIAERVFIKNNKFFKMCFADADFFKKYWDRAMYLTTKGYRWSDLWNEYTLDEIDMFYHGVKKAENETIKELIEVSFDTLMNRKN